MMDYLPGALIIGVGATLAGRRRHSGRSLSADAESHHARRLRRWTLCCWLDCEPHGCGV